MSRIRQGARDTNTLDILPLPRLPALPTPPFTLARRSFGLRCPTGHYTGVPTPAAYRLFGFYTCARRTTLLVYWRRYRDRDTWPSRRILTRQGEECRQCEGARGTRPG